MRVTEIKLKVVDEGRLLAYFNVTFDNCFVVRDLRLIDGERGLFVSMPDRWITDHCEFCQCKNPTHAAYCSRCGGALRNDRFVYDNRGEVKLRADVCFPTEPSCRAMIQEAALKAYRQEKELMQRGSYKPTGFSEFGDQSFQQQSIR